MTARERFAARLADYAACEQRLYARGLLTRPAVAVVPRRTSAPEPPTGPPSGARFGVRRDTTATT